MTLTLTAETFEEGAAQLCAALDALDEQYAAQVRAGLGALLARGLSVAHPAMGALAASLSGRLALEGAAALWTEDAAGYPAPTRATPAEEGMQDALRLAGTPGLEDLAALVAHHAATDVHDYAREVALTALIEAAAPERDLSMDDRIDAVEAARPLVRALPSRREIAADTAYEVLPGDTVRDVAYAVLGDYEAWPQLVELYGLVPPYVSSFGRADGVLFPGQRLLVPRGTEAAEGSAGGLGQTLALTVEDRSRVDLALTDSGDLALASGMPGFASDLGLRALTPAGDLPEEPEYGVPSVAGLPATEEMLARTTLLYDALYQDPRVGQVTAAHNVRSDVARGVLVEDVVVLPRPDLVGV